MFEKTFFDVLDHHAPEKKNISSSQSQTICFKTDANSNYEKV